MKKIFECSQWRLEPEPHRFHRVGAAFVVIVARRLKKRIGQAELQGAATRLRPSDGQRDHLQRIEVFVRDTVTDAVRGFQHSAFSKGFMCNMVRFVASGAAVLAST